MIRAYQRAMELIEKRKAEASLPDSEWFGEEGKAYKVEKGTKKKPGVDNSVTVKILGGEHYCRRLRHHLHLPHGDSGGSPDDVVRFQ
jgi:hypothetical protein